MALITVDMVVRMALMSVATEGMRAVAMAAARADAMAEMRDMVAANSVEGMGIAAIKTKRHR